MKDVLSLLQLKKTQQILKWSIIEVAWLHLSKRYRLYRSLLFANIHCMDHTVTAIVKSKLVKQKFDQCLDYTDVVLVLQYRSKVRRKTSLISRDET